MQNCKTWIEWKGAFNLTVQIVFVPQFFQCSSIFYYFFNSTVLQLNYLIHNGDSFLLFLYSCVSSIKSALKRWQWLAIVGFGHTICRLNVNRFISWVFELSIGVKVRSTKVQLTSNEVSYNIYEVKDFLFFK